MPIAFHLKKILSILLTPPLLPLLWIGFGLYLLRGRKKLAWPVTLSGLLLAFALITPAPVSLLISPLENSPPISQADLKSVQAIIILGGGQRRHAEEYGTSVPNRLGLERIFYGAHLARQSGLPILITGGAPTGAMAEAQLMANVMKNDMGIKVKWIEGRSLDTADNARFSAQILRQAGITRVAVVSHAAHLRRALAEFRAQGLDVVGAPTVFMGRGPNGEESFDFTPSMSSAYAGWYAVHEWLGIAAQQIRFLFSGTAPKPLSGA